MEMICEFNKIRQRGRYGKHYTQLSFRCVKLETPVPTAHGDNEYAIQCMSWRLTTEM